MARIEFGTAELKPVNPLLDTKAQATTTHLESPHLPQNTNANVEAVADSCRFSNTSDQSIKENYVVSTDIMGIEKSQLTTRSHPRFMFIVRLEWKNGLSSYIARDHDDFFRYHSWILDNFRAEAGYLGTTRAIPVFPARTWFRNDLKLAEKRKPLIKEYLNNVLKIKSISQCQQAQAFFKARPGDPQDDDPILKRETVHSSAENQVEAKGINSTIRISEDSSIGCKQSYSGGATSAEQMEKESHDNFSFHPDNDDIEALKSKITYDTEAANVY